MMTTMRTSLASTVAAFAVAFAGCDGSGTAGDAGEDETAADTVEADVHVDGETIDSDAEGDEEEGEGEADAALDGDEAAPSCRVEDVVGTLPGVRISIEADTCVFNVGEGGEFRYRVSVEPGMEPTLHVTAGTDWGDCNICGASPLSCVQEWVGSDAANYCECGSPASGVDPQPAAGARTNRATTGRSHVTLSIVCTSVGRMFKASRPVLYGSSTPGLVQRVRREGARRPRGRRVAGAA